MPKIKVGDKVKVISIPGVNIDNHPDIKQNTFTVVQILDGEYTHYQLDSSDFVFGENDLEVVSRNINGHLWLIANRITGKVIEGYETRQEARDNLSLTYFSPEKFNIIKYEFK